jgi:hypothetical protein
MSSSGGYLGIPIDTKDLKSNGRQMSTFAIYLLYDEVHVVVGQIIAHLSCNFLLQFNMTSTK